MFLRIQGKGNRTAVPAAEGCGREMDLAGWIEHYFTDNIFSEPGAIDSVCFVLSVLFVFYSWKGGFFKGKNLLFLLAHAAGLYAGLLLFSLLLTLCSETAMVVSYLAKFLTLTVYVAFFNRYSWQAKIILGVLLYACYMDLYEIGASLQGILNATGTISLPFGFRTYILVLGIAIGAFMRWQNVEQFHSIPFRTIVWSVGCSAVGVALAILRSVVMPYTMVFEGTEDYVYGLYPQIYIFVSLICIVIFILICYFFFVQDMKSHQEKLELSRKLASQENAEALAAVNETNLQQIRKIRHEVKNRYAIMQVLLENKQYDQLESYFREIYNGTSAAYAYVDTGNETFDMIFNLEYSKAVSKNIEVDTKLIVPPEMPVERLDLCSLITNLMDNAIEACEKITDGERRIDVSAQVVHRYFVMSISNTVAPGRADTALSLVTDKDDCEMHGYGSKIVDDVVKKYNGQILRRVEDNMFIVNMMLDPGLEDAEDSGQTESAE